MTKEVRDVKNVVVRKRVRAWAQEGAGNAPDTGVAGESREDATNSTVGNHSMPMNHLKESLEPEHLRHFGLAADPFFDLNDPGDIWRNDRLKLVRAKLEQAIEHQEIAVVTGNFGAGKSTILRHCLGALARRGRVRIITPDRLNRREMTGDMLTAGILDELASDERRPREVVKRDRLAKRLLSQAIERGERPVLVIDEAHDLRDQVIISLKRLWDSGLFLRTLAIVLVGAGGKDEAGRSWGLRWELESNPDLREFSERTRLIDLGRMVDDLPDYLAWRFGRVGVELGAVFEGLAVTDLVERARTPQLLNTLAVKAMKAAYIDGHRRVMAHHVGAVH
ncbi:ExeA family protein [Thiocapsa rosea]|uniref:Type II secretion system protein A n=1 Tax=Thiocapsa rosea TaxID=69360 RepID=A0A495V9P5_9GAMM|nr:AAA family ATPase [Thiocapsa rosea]RKT44508.1 type II secretion system protein A [Thiocapsa rosea]